MSQGPAMSRRRLGAELKRYRDEAGLTLEQAATALECSTSKISRLENGKGLPKQRDVRDLARLYGKEAEGHLEMLLRLARDGARAGWWQEYTPLLTTVPFVFDGTDRYAALESDASWISAYDPACVHGLLQTADYTRAVLREVLPHHSAAEVDSLVEFRLRRQEVFTRQDQPLRAHFIVDENVFRRGFGASIMAAQVDHLREMASMGNVVLQVLEFSAGFLRATSGGQFAILGFDDSIDQDVVFVESAAGTSFLEGDFGVDTFKGVFDDAVGRALSPADSLDWLTAQGNDLA